MEMIRLGKLALGSVVLALIAGSASIARSAPLTIEQCIAEALRKSPELSAARHEIAAAMYDITKTQGTTLPYLSAQLNADEVNGSAVTPFSTLNSYEPENPAVVTRRGVVLPRQISWGPEAGQSIQMTYPLFQYGSILGLNDPPVVAAARAVLGEQEWNILLFAQKVILDVTSSFLDALLYRDLLQLDEKMVALSEKRLDIVREQVSLQLRLPQDVELAKAQLEASQQAATSARQNAEDALLQLATLMGRVVDERLEPNNTSLPLPPLPDLKKFFDAVMPLHPALRVEEGKVEVAKQQYLVDRSTLLPTLSLNTIFQAAQNLAHFNGGTFHFNPTVFLSYIQVDLPIFDFGQRRAAVHESKEKLSAQQAMLKQVNLDIRGAITATYSQIYDIDEKLAALRADYTKASNDVLLARAEREQGLIDELTLVDAELALLSARASLVSAKQMEQIRYAELQNLSGGTWHWMR